MKRNINIIILLSILIILNSGCIYNEDIIIPTVALFEDYVDCNKEYIVKISDSNDKFVIDVIKEGKIVSQLQCDAYGIEPRLVAVGQKGYYLLDDLAEDIMIAVNFDSEIIARKKIPRDVNSISCKNGYVFLEKFPERYLDVINGEYFFEEDNVSGDIQILSQENISTLTDITLYKSDEGYSTEPTLENHTKIYEDEDIQVKELLNKGEEYKILQSRLQNQNLCHVVEYQKGYQIYGWINCYDDSYSESLGNKELPLLSSITKGIAYKINTKNGKTEILEEREEGILLSSENKIVYIQDDGKIFCHYIDRKKVKEIACIKLQSDICLKKDLLIWYEYDETETANIIRY